MAARTRHRQVTRTARQRSSGDTVVVGLDPSLTGYGVVALRLDGTVVTVQLVKTKAEQTYAARLITIQRAIIDALRGQDVALICMERPAYDASGAFTGGLVHAATALALAERFGLQHPNVAPALVATNTLKKFVTGKGNGPKSVIIKGVYKKWGYDTDDDNLADAYGLARLAAAVLFGQSEHRYEQDCIDTVKRSMTWAPLPPPPPSQTTPRKSSPPTASDSTSPRSRRTRSSSVSASPPTPSNSRRASRSRSRTAAASPSVE